MTLDFLDHLLRESPSKNPQFTPLKRSFFTPNSQHMAVGGGVDAYKGVYQSMRLAQVRPRTSDVCYLNTDFNKGGRLVINLDVSNTCFWGTGGLISQACHVLRCRDPQELTQKTRWVKNATGALQESEGFRNLRKLAKVRVKAMYRGCPVPDQEFQIKSFIREDAKSYTVEIKDRATGIARPQSVFDYFRTKYNVVLQNWQLPLCQMTKKGVLYPMEVLTLTGHQRYPFKLDEDQTAKMIKFAVTLPNKRLEAIKEGQSWLNWQQDPVLAKFGLKVDANMLKTKARVLPNPVIQFGGPGTTGQLNPGTTGRWDLKGKKFFSTNPQPLESWGVCVFNSGRFRLEQAQIGNFIEAFVKAYKAHGGQVRNEKPMMFVGPQDAGEAVEQTVNRTGNMFKKRPQILLFCVPDKNAFHYLRIKKSCDCRYGIVSQVMQNAQIQKCNPQYISNVLMKVNAKLGGCTSKAISKAGVVEFKVPTMIIGADVSHASPGSAAPSMAALTVSIDRHAGRYAAACETNGSRVEMITEANIYSMLRPLFQHWQETVGGGQLPNHVYYFRDGVSEGQFQHVLQQEVPHMKKLMREMAPAWDGKFVVVVASKRHHIRFFPNPTDRNAADRNGNPLPGTLVEYDVTDPFTWDYYLNAHSAIQGTARPTHYHVLTDEIGLQPNQFQNMVYEHSYQYMRSTTPVSLFPAVYYAHLASNRARAHENVASSSGPQSGPGHQDAKAGPKGSGGSDGPPTEHARLLPMYNQTGIRHSMWYI
jgi:eukaryotic translation initiation factor 2C